jgi:hypothetical protein
MLRSAASVVMRQTGERLEIANPDAELIRLCDEMLAVHRRWVEAIDATGYYRNEDVPSDLAKAADKADSAVWAIADKIKGMHPVTMAGVRAKAGAALFLWAGGATPDKIPDANVTNEPTISLLVRCWSSWRRKPRRAEPCRPYRISGPLARAAFL